MKKRKEKLKKIVFVAKHNRSFVKNDKRMLSKHYKITTDTSRKSIKNADMVYCWFASTHAIKPLIYARWYDKPFVVVTGGYDVAYLPGKHSYGLATSHILKHIPKYILKHSSLILTVSDFNTQETKRLTKNHNMVCIPNSIVVNPTRVYKKENIVITVGYVDDVSYHRKGIDRFIKAAELMPDVNFYIIGKVKTRYMPKKLPSNLQMMGYVDNLEEWYKKARVYCQFSRYESFGLSVIEAMNYGCIPVVFNAGALPEIVGEYGIISNSEDSLDKDIYNALSMKQKPGLVDWLSQFDNKHREKKIIEVIENL